MRRTQRLAERVEAVTERLPERCGFITLLNVGALGGDFREERRAAEWSVALGGQSCGMCAKDGSERSHGPWLDSSSGWSNKTAIASASGTAAAAAAAAACARAAAAAAAGSACGCVLGGNEHAGWCAASD